MLGEPQTSRGVPCRVYQENCPSLQGERPQTRARARGSPNQNAVRPRAESGDQSRRPVSGTSKATLCNGLLFGEGWVDHAPLRAVMDPIMNKCLSELNSLVVVK